MPAAYNPPPLIAVLAASNIWDTIFTCDLAVTRFDWWLYLLHLIPGKPLLQLSTCNTKQAPAIQVHPHSIVTFKGCCVSAAFNVWEKEAMRQAMIRATHNINDFYLASSSAEMPFEAFIVM
jgi:hypothetical protein